MVRTSATVACLALLLAALLVAPAPQPAAAPPLSAAAPPWTLSGRVFKGPKPLELPPALPAAGVRITLYGSDSPGWLGEVLLSTVTNEGGWFDLTTPPDVKEVYHLVLTVPRFYSAGGCSSVGGTCMSDTWIQYVDLFESKVLNSNRFWILPPATATPTPTLTTPPGSPVVLDLCARAETWINELQPGTNYGGASTFAVGFGAGQNEPIGHRYGLVRFELDFLPPGTIVEVAYLALGLQSAGGVASVQIPVYVVGDPWDEMTVNWDTQPNVLPDIITTASVGMTPGTVIQWDIRGLVQRWVNRDLPNNGLELRGPEAAFWQRSFEAGEYSAFCPSLHLEVRSPVSFPTPTSIPTLTPTITPTPVCLYPDAAGNTFATASLLPSTNISYTEEYICPSNDRDYWKFHVDAGQWISITLNHWLTNVDTDLYLFPPVGGATLAKSLNPAGVEDSIEYWAYVSGDWVVEVTGKYASDWSKSYPYRLRVNTCISDQGGPTFDAATVISTSLPAAGTQYVYSDYICPQGDEDWWQFSMPRGQTTTVSIKLTNLPADYRLELYDSDGTLKKSLTTSGTANKTLTWTTSSSWVPLGGFPSNWRVRVYGAPSGSGSAYHSTQPYHLEVSMAGVVDLTIQELEVTQGIQDLSNSVALVSGKLTRARVYVGVSPPVTSLSDLVVRLYGWYGNYNGTSLPGSPLTFGPATYAVTSTSVANMRLVLGSTFNFLIPSTWLTHGKLYLRAEVNPGQVVPETNYSNNYLMDSVKCGSCSAVNLGLVAVTSGGITVSLNSTLVTNMLSYFKDVYPMSTLNVWTPASGAFEATRNYAAASSKPGVCSSAWGDLASDMNDFYDNWSNRPAHAFVYGLLNENVPHCQGGGCNLGCSSGSGNGSCGILSSEAGPTLAHEVGHTLGRKHAPCGLGKAPPDPNWPNGTYPGGIIGQVGVRWSSSTVFEPNTPDIMSYCSPPWISPYTYWGLWGGLCGMNSAALQETAADAAAPAPCLIASGQITGDAVALRPFWQQDYPAGEYNYPGEGPYSIELQNSGGSLLFVRRFDPVASGEALRHTDDRFHEIVPFHPSTARIVIRHGDLILTTVTVSAHKPSVTLLSPNGGESWDDAGAHTVSWTSFDLDGDPAAHL
ncbi:MAG TPA: DNRLRE domain-containing protein, partial [Anaerolineae bacterium]|nr:DNRLRE domain-containing protein [Anaerolineae bacterium]